MAYVILYETTNNPELLIREIKALISNTIGPIAKPDRVLIVNGLPKTRSGKIMRRILRKLASNEMGQLGDVSTLLNPEIVDEIKRALTI